MNQTKLKLKFFDVMDYDKEALYLSEMHQRGWKLDHITFPCFYHFVACDPDHIRYQLDYNKDGIENKAEYTQMFKDCGWEYLFDFVGYSYFRKPEEASDMEEIFCDDDSRMDMIKRIFRGRILPMILLFFLALIPVMWVGIHEAIVNQESCIALLVEFGIIDILYVSIIGRFIVKYLDFKRKLGR
ncbi:MAG: DUF2812 domain-containing protein [Lachnospiraceae bacterium]|nr:DUF2812 domain-containing protein [Lachnospiraceae bacterium]